eukprot:727038-Pleurochrysis_carterae.AAC.2
MRVARVATTEKASSACCCRVDPEAEKLARRAAETRAARLKAQPERKEKSLNKSWERMCAAQVVASSCCGAGAAATAKATKAAEEVAQMQLDARCGGR